MSELTVQDRPCEIASVNTKPPYPTTPRTVNGEETQGRWRADRTGAVGIRMSSFALLLHHKDSAAHQHVETATHFARLARILTRMTRTRVPTLRGGGSLPEYWRSRPDWRHIRIGIDGRMGHACLRGPNSPRREDALFEIAAVAARSARSLL